MTEKKLAANRTNGRKSRGAVTPEGKARAAKANLRHGFYSKADEEVLLALGEDPAEYRRMMKSLETHLAEAIEAQVVGRIGRTFWRMQRAERMQDGLALKRVQSGLEMAQLAVAPAYTRNYDIYERLEGLGEALKQPDFSPSAAEIQTFVNGFGVSPPDEIQKLFPLLRSLGKAAGKAPGLARQDGATEPVASAAPGQEKNLARQKLLAGLESIMTTYRMACGDLIQKCEEARSPENIAALMAPRDEEALLMQRWEDSNQRQLWRLINILVKVRKGALNLRDRDQEK
jgi:hypothetical protein